MVFCTASCELCARLSQARDLLCLKVSEFGVCRGEALFPVEAVELTLKTGEPAICEGGMLLREPAGDAIRFEYRGRGFGAVARIGSEQVRMIILA